MPLWYSRASEEHRAVRESAGLFDVSHMGRIRIKGDYAGRFLDIVTTNFIHKLRIGQACYSYVLDPDGDVMDDIFVYKIQEDDYILVVNAVNAEKIIQWFNAVNSREFIIDKDDPAVEIEKQVKIIDLRAPSEDQNVNIALQGPDSIKILSRLIRSGDLHLLKRNHIAAFDLDGINLLIARTGYTGEQFGYEIFVDAKDAVHLWQILLKTGKEFGLKPCGLAARDSIRIEAGLPLYGHELAGRFNILPIEAGYGSFIKRHKPFFVGRRSHLEKEKDAARQIVCFRVENPGARKIKANDPIVNRSGECIGAVTSCALVTGVQVGMALIERAYAIEGTKIGIFPIPERGKIAEEGSKKELLPGKKVLLHEEAVITPRFPFR
jgi:glycine hydroxymethyltransferase